MRFIDKNIFNRFNAKKALAILLLSSSLLACSSSDDEDPSTKVAELSELENAFDVEILWDRSVGDGVSDYFSRIKPIVAYNKVYSASRMGDVIAFDKESGKEVWQADLSDITHERRFW